MYDFLVRSRNYSFITNYSDRSPRLARLGMWNRIVSTGTPSPRRLGRLQVRPVEGYRTWNRVFGEHQGVAGEHDVGEPEADLAVRIIDAHERAFHGRPFLNKNTANTRRVGALDAIFPDARWLFVVRDPRAVAVSLSKVRFWPGMDMWWRGGGTVSDAIVQGESSLVLAAECWRVEVDAARRALEHVNPTRWAVVKYEDVVRDPMMTLSGLESWLRLGEGVLTDQIAARTLHDATARTLAELPPDVAETIMHTAGPDAARFGYGSP